ncbi:unnamed protein product [Lupinus luteus]|uniref:Uncharacterized protein n=1 Tax=Lupinus luteus TaxID=3873 RepID=A0AAV1X5F3_LUPLU
MHKIQTTQPKILVMIVVSAIPTLEWYSNQGSDSLFSNVSVQWLDDNGNWNFDFCGWDHGTQRRKLLRNGTTSGTNNRSLKSPA